MTLKIAILIPDRNDRPELLSNCLRMINNQTVRPDIVELVNDKSPFKEGEVDITWRYRTGYDRLRNKGLDCILFMENDDYYANDYIESMTRAWIDHNRPKIFGTSYTMYYHLGIRKICKFNHGTRSSAMSTLIQPDLKIIWGRDTNPYTDSQLWKTNNLKGLTWDPGRHICIGIKHNIGLCGGRYHSDKYTVSGQLRRGDFSRYRESDPEFKFLRQHMNDEAYNFYTNIKL